MNEKYSKLWNCKYFNFIAQFNLNEISQFIDSEIIPKTGMLYFFIDEVSEGNDLGGSNIIPKLIYSNSDIENLEFKELPEELLENFKNFENRANIRKKTFPIEFNEGLFIPSRLDIIMKNINKIPNLEMN